MNHRLQGHVLELVYKHGLEPCPERDVGSTPTMPTNDLLD